MSLVRINKDQVHLFDTLFRDRKPQAPNISVSAETLEPGEEASASLSGPASNPTYEFNIPRGEDGEVTQSAFDALAAKVDHKAEPEGEYEDLTVGTAEHLLTDDIMTSIEPYVLTPTVGDFNSCYLKQLTGGSVVFNQYLREMNSTYWNAYSSDNAQVAFADGVATATILTTLSAQRWLHGVVQKAGLTYTVEAGHKYFLSVDVYSEKALNISVELVSSSGMFVGSTTAGKWTRLTKTMTANAQTLKRGLIYPTNGVAEDTYSIKNYMFVDLTQMFGSSIADYIHALETGTPGAGVAWLKKYFPEFNNYQPHNPGTFAHVTGVSERRVVGVNQWDEEWEVGNINSNTGENSSSSTVFRSKNYIPLFLGKDYYFKFNGTDTIGLRFYAEDKSYIKNYALSTQANSLLVRGTSRLPENAAFLRFVNTSQVSYNNDICINLSDPTINGQYFPYETYTYPLDDSLTLRGVPKLDSSNRLYFDGDTYEADGKVTRKYGIVDLGTLTWTLTNPTYTTDRVFVTSINDKAFGFANYELTKSYTKTGAGTSAIHQDGYNKTTRGHASNTNIYIRDDDYDTVALFTAAMSGVYLIYELATPTTETADPYQEFQLTIPGGTEEFVTTGFVPVGHETQYRVDSLQKLETLPDSPTTDGDYILRHSSTGNAYVPREKELPAAQNEGSRVLKCKVENGTPTYMWDYLYKKASGSIASFSNGLGGVPLKSLEVNIEPVQDLHGQSAPYPAGGGKNKFDADTFYSGYKQSDGSFIMSGSTATTKTFYIPQSLVGQSLVFSASARIPSGSTITSVRLRATVNGEPKYSSYVTGDTYTRTSVQFTPESTADYVLITYGSGGSQNLQFKDVMLEVGSVVSDYAPYSNICPISGWTGANVQRRGKNLIDNTVKSTASGGWVYFNNAGNNRTPTSYLPPGTYTFTYETTNWTGAVPHIFVRDTDANASAANVYNAKRLTFTLTKGINACLLVQAPDLTPANIIDAQLEVGASATALEAFSGSVYPISWQSSAGTVYGGYVDAIRGKLVATYYKDVFSGAPSTSSAPRVNMVQQGNSAEGTVYITYLANTTASYSHAPKKNQASNINMITNMFKIGSINTNQLHYGEINSSGVYTRIILLDQTLDTVAKVNAWLTENPLEICYELDTPIEYNLTPAIIQTLQGTNNIYADYGSIRSAIYPVDIE